MGRVATRGRAPAGVQLRAVGRGHPVPDVPAAHACRAAAHTAVELAHHERPLLPGVAADGDLLAIQPARLRAAVLVLACGDRHDEAVHRGVRHVPARAGSGHALRGGAPGRAGLRLQPLRGRVAALAARQRVHARPVVAAPRPAACTPTYAPDDRRPGGRGGAPVLRRHARDVRTAADRHGSPVRLSGRAGARAAGPLEQGDAVLRARAHRRSGPGRRDAHPVHPRAVPVLRLPLPQRLPRRAGACALPAGLLPPGLLGTRAVHVQAVRDLHGGPRDLPGRARGHAAGSGRRAAAQPRATRRGHLRRSWPLAW